MNDDVTIKLNLNRKKFSRCHMSVNILAKIIIVQLDIA